MEILGIRSEPGPGIVREELLVLRGERLPQRGERARIRRDRLCRSGELETENAEELGRARRLGARVAQCHVQSCECRLVASDELDLELPESGRDALAVEDADRVVDDLGAVDLARLPARPQPRNADELRAAQVRDEETGQPLRRTRGNARLFELQARGTARDLELPHPAAVLDAVAQRDPTTRESEITAVEVRRDERPGRKLLPESGKHEVLARYELQLSLDCLAHRLSLVPTREGRPVGRPSSGRWSVGGRDQVRLAAFTAR